jgi:F-type H+-transporting ATPase subunit a
MHISLAAEPIFHIAGFPVTNSLLVAVFVSLLMMTVAFIVSRNLKKVPVGTQNVIEIAVESLVNLAESVGGKSTRKFMPLIITFFLFILLSNWMGLLPFFGSVGFYEIEEGHKVFIPFLRGATADLNTTFALAIASVFSIQYFGFSSLKLGYLKKFFNFSSPIMFLSGILELVSEFAKIMSFAFRLFGNVFAGEVLLMVIAFLVPVVAPLPFFGLEIFVGFIQALVFSMLTLIFLNIATQSHGEEVQHGS